MINNINTMNDLSRKYFDYLVGLVRDDDTFEYWELMGILFDMEFTWSIPNDDNRSADGLELRREFPELVDSKTPCTVLEMLIALSIRCDRDIMGNPENPKPKKLFWIMLDNLELLDEQDGRADDKYIIITVQKWLDREYSDGGVGGIFPVFTLGKNQKESEIWGQMMSYLDENFGYEW